MENSNTAPTSHTSDNRIDGAVGSKPLSRQVSINRVTLGGRLVADPICRTTKTGKAMTTARVVTSDGHRADYHTVVLWSPLAETVNRQLRKDGLVYVDGHLRSRSYQHADGSRRYVVEVVADEFRLIPAEAVSSGTSI